MDTLVSDDNRGARHCRIFHSGYFDYRRAFEQFLICTAVQWDEHCRQRTIMDSSLSDIIEVRNH